jgi:hypothetical protein
LKIPPFAPIKPTLFLGVLCVAVLCVILSLGLWPFHPPSNAVSWLKQTNGIELGRFGTVLGSGELAVQDGTGGSVEIWVQPDRWQSSATLLALYRPENGVLFSLRQSLTDLEVQCQTAHSRTHFYASEALGPSLRQKKAVFITVTSGPDGTRVYLDGGLFIKAARFTIPRDELAGRLIVGDGPLQPDSFRGQIRGVAIYDGELTAAQVLRHYQSWTGDGAPKIVQEEHNAALYLFREKTGTVVHNQAPGGVDLQIPERYTVVDKIALEPFWREFDLTRSYWSGNLKNVVGFIPVGFCFYAFLVVVRPTRRVELWTLVLGFLLSLTIEVLQTYLPTRDSGTTDLITNTLGTYLGVLCYREIYPLVVARIPILRWFQTMEPRPEENGRFTWWPS